MEPRPVPNPFGSSLTELRAALACFDLVDEVARATSGAPTERDHLALVYAGWSLARAAGRAEHAYARGAEVSP